MDDDFDDGFFAMDQLLMEEGLLASSVQTTETWQRNLSRPEPKDLTNAQKTQIVFHCLALKKDGKLPYGVQARIAKELGCHKSTVSKIMKRAQEQIARGEAIDVSSLKRGRVGRKPTYENKEEWLQSAPLHLRQSYRAYAGALKCSHMHVFRLLKKGLLRAHTSPNHPNVSDKNKIDRIKWVLSHIEPATIESRARFIDMKNTIHIDEKWFYLNPTTRRFYLLPKEIDPYRTSKSKNYSIKVMFMGVTSRPIYSEDGELLHDGKFGIFPFISKERAKKKSKNRPAGTMETKAVTKVNQQVTRDMMINQVIPAIKEKWPACMPKQILIQQDNARPHLVDTDPAFRAAASSDGFDMHIINQPAQSPDFNVLDLGLFRALQSLQYQSFPKDVDDLIQKVHDAYEDFQPTLIRHAFISLQLVMVEALKVKGGNNYKVPHIGKKRLERLGQLPDVIEVDQQLIDDSVAYLNEVCGLQGEETNTENEDDNNGYTPEFINAYIEQEEQWSAYLDGLHDQHSDNEESDEEMIE